MIGGAVILFLIWLFSGSGSSSSRAPTPRIAKHEITGDPPVVIVTVMDEKVWADNPEYLKSIKENRERYAAKHGYKVFLVSAGGYDLNGAPITWSKITATRHALAKFPDCKYVWFLEQNAFIMNPSLKIEDDIMDPVKIEKKMIKDLPVVPPDSIIRTFSHLKGEDVEFVVTQDKDGLSSGSFILRNGEWAQFFLDTWFDPLYRSYNFQKAETHALEHIVQWHPTILSKLAIVPQRVLNSYSKSTDGELYQDEDIVVRFASCTHDQGANNCVDDSKRFTQLWRRAFDLV